VVSLRTAPTHYLQAGAPPWLRELGRLQTQLSEGPTVQAMQALVPVEHDPQGATRWGQLNRALARAGHCGLLAVPIRIEGAAAGAFTFAHPDQGASDERDRLIAEVLAEQAALVVDSRRRITQLREAVASRDLIGQAKGVLMAKHQIDATAAFAMLVRASKEINIKDADVASGYINDSAQRPDRPPPNTASMT
jgi:GAF domain-containing protein